MNCEIYSQNTCKGEEEKKATTTATRHAYILETKAEIENGGAGQWELKLSYLK